MDEGGTYTSLDATEDGDAENVAHATPSIRFILR